MTQEQVDEAMGTTQAVVARLESGRTMPSTGALERFAKATHTRLRISFEPEKSGDGDRAAKARLPRSRVSARPRRGRAV